MLVTRLICMIWKIISRPSRRIRAELSHFIQVAAYLLKQYKEKFEGGTLAVTWNYLRESMNTYLSQPNPVTARWESADHLRDPKFQLDAFQVSMIAAFLI